MRIVLVSLTVMLPSVFIGLFLRSNSRSDLIRLKRSSAGNDVNSLSWSRKVVRLVARLGKLAGSAYKMVKNTQNNN